MRYLRPLSTSISVAGQLQPDEMALLAAEGVRSVINNRPDGEEPGQPTSEQMQAAAIAAGLTYLHAPISGLPDDDCVASVQRLLGDEQPADTRTVLFCRSGMRSAIVWAMAETRSGRITPDEARAAAAAAGYDLERIPL